MSEQQSPQRVANKSRSKRLSKRRNRPPSSQRSSSRSSTTSDDDIKEEINSEDEISFSKNDESIQEQLMSLNSSPEIEKPSKLLQIETEVKPSRVDRQPKVVS